MDAPCEYVGGGPWDGRVERLEATVRVRVVYAYRPVAVSPWGEDARDPADQLCRGIPTGAYHREGRVMRWRPA